MNKRQAIVESSWSHAGQNEGRCSCGGCTAPSETALVWKRGLKAWSQSLSSLVLVKVKCLLSGALSEPASSAAMCPPNAGQDAQLPPGCLDRHMGCNPWPKQAGSSQLLPSLGLAVGVGPGRAVGHDAGGWQGVLLKAAPCWEAGSRTCCAGAALCFFFCFGGFPKNGAFCNPPSLSQNFSWQNLSKTSGNSAFGRRWG